jgi:hypothetical protein
LKQQHKAAKDVMKAEAAATKAAARADAAAAKAVARATAKEAAAAAKATAKEAAAAAKAAAKAAAVRGVIGEVIENNRPGAAALELKPLKVEYNGDTIDLPIDVDSSAADVVVAAANAFGIDSQTVYVCNGPFRLQMADHVVGMKAVTLCDK